MSCQCFILLTDISYLTLNLIFSFKTDRLEYQVNEDKCLHNILIKELNILSILDASCNRK